LPSTVMMADSDG